MESFEAELEKMLPSKGNDDDDNDDIDRELFEKYMMEQEEDNKLLEQEEFVGSQEKKQANNRYTGRKQYTHPYKLQYTRTRTHTAARAQPHSPNTM